MTNPRPANLIREEIRRVERGARISARLAFERSHRKGDATKAARTDEGKRELASLLDAALTVRARRLTQLHHELRASTMDHPERATLSTEAIFTRRFTIHLPCSVVEAEHGGIVLAAMASGDGAARLAHVLVVDVNCVGAPNAGASATNGMETIVGKLSGDLCEALRVIPSRTVWAAVDSDGHFDYVTPQWPMIVGKNKPIPVSWGPVLYPPLPARSAQAYYEPRGSEARRLVSHVQTLLGDDGAPEAFGAAMRRAAAEASSC